MDPVYDVTLDNFRPTDYSEVPSAYPNYLQFTSNPTGGVSGTAIYTYLSPLSSLSLNIGSSGGLTIFAAFSLSKPTFSSQRVFDCALGSSISTVRPMANYLLTESSSEKCAFPPSAVRFHVV